MDDDDWKQILQILKELEGENGYITFPISGEFVYTSNMLYSGHDVLKSLCEQWDPMDSSDTSLAQDMLKQIGVKV